MAIAWVALGAGVFAGLMVWRYRLAWTGCDPFDLDGQC